jgi:hypothetical protein
MVDIDDFDKDQLSEYAQTMFKVDLDLRKNLDTLKKEVLALQEKSAAKTKGKVAAEKPIAKKGDATHILNRDTGYWFPYTELLARHLTNAVPCDQDGNPV